MVTVSSVNRSKSDVKLTRVVAIGAALLSLAACNTVAGAGKDVSSVGHDVSRGASSAQQGIANSTGASSQ
ncbi:hypothetical protein AA23498_3351 [Acetobacter nitrogenifigens DSM 23921 = NBRC 105050]|uniref:Entericidin n=1 Tax=Acetobacter nitrogenifigens DSM 23921 = NBRC 105050 TaxID=1120919 RepID=A0A511X6N1_9PROT|nr:entericidin A/B family lipoprotein [Acetobacter nitrogenifigens]GBQ98902.1 hypothetical protein AA23498_3351 [Acetobacter nitrogenifigens DSM 23921 = NBRC 105050]GEN58613.1 hypothetical protein ANI02nite_04970 [Acetobacter nitrogenifigens DSM 23921 = NBRC 105050]